MNQSVRWRFSVTQVVLVLFGAGLSVWALCDDYLIGGGAGFGMAQLMVLLVGLAAVFGALMPGSVPATTLSIFLSLFFALGVAEFVLQSQYGPQFESAYELDDELLYKLKPGARRQYTHLPANGGTHHIYEVNQQGYRGTPIGEKREGRLRGVVFGDSFIHAEFSRLENTFSNQLENMLQHEGAPIDEIVNAGVAGYGLDQVALRLNGDMLRLDPDFVVVSIFAGNDFGDLLRNKLFKLSGNNELLRLHPTMLPEITFQAELGAREFLLRKVLRSLRNSFFRPEVVIDPHIRINEAYRQHLDEYRQFVVEGDTVVRELRSDPYSADMSLTPNAASAKYKRRMMEQVMLRIQSETAARGLPVLFFFVPHPMDVMGGSHTSGQVDLQRWQEYSPDAQVDALTDICERHQLECVSLMPIMRERGAEQTYLKGGDDHWSDLGQQIAAAEVAKALVARGVVTVVGNAP